MFKIIWYTCSILESLALYVMYYYMNSIHVWINMYALILTKIYIPWSLYFLNSFDENRILHILGFMFMRKEFHVLLMRMSFINLYPCICFLYDSYTLDISFVYSWFWFMSLYELYKFLSVNSRVIFIYYEIYICFIPYLKDFVLVFKIIIKPVSYSSIW